MHKRIGPLLLWLFVINLGIAFGAGVYEARVVLPQWAHLPPQTWPNTGLLFWVYVTTVPLTLLTLANLITACLERGPRRAWWLGAVALTLVERLATFSYFIPTMLRLMGAESWPEVEVQATLSHWMLLNHGRHMLTLAAWLVALRAFSRPYARNG